ncbi:hypothetical protein HYH03_007871 [Edaphochlamys debaryana]|uniref:TNase-like domain-containing protein n=1 Tax=Edaphochlamys debaryana TaxID=47281 RepID=A0A835Y4F3_9CHLO|nr:hypothetical protein HYH03_007871 [Edaphochlamys debaryana]|eukprot:KAG2493941.1 hypothetical protein HYH03_007871 [Edaphochlamys debaryana]
MATTMKLPSSKCSSRPSCRARAVAFRPVCALARGDASSSSGPAAFGRALLAGVASAIVLATGAADADPSIIAGAARVVDGDTLVINGERIRMYGVDAPESAQQCKDPRGAAYPCGLVSKDALDKKIGSAPVRCEVKTKDQYGRNVSVCTAGGEDLNGWLVSNGYAVAYRQYGKEYIPNEDAASAAKKGIWAGQFQVPSEWRKENKRQEGGAVLPAVPLAAAPNAGTRPAGPGGDPPPPCPTGPAVKGNISAKGEKIYHVSGGRYYDSTRIDLKDGEKYFCSEAEAVAAGWRKSGQ